nr:uncharacterized protein LOC113703420 isoform X1 [Coffea arabica]
MKKRNMALASARSIIHSTKIKQFLIISSISRLFLVRGNNSLAAKLVQVPLSRIKETLDSEEKIHFSTLKSQDFSWDGLVSALLSSSFPRKANLHMPVQETRRQCKLGTRLEWMLGNIDRRTVKKVVALYLELGRVEDLEELLVVLSNSNQASDILSYVHHAIIRMYVRAARLDDVEFAVGRMLKHGMSFRFPDDVENVICLYFRQAAYERLDLFLECIRDSFTLRRSTYDLLVAGYRRAGLQEKLDMVIDEMKQNGFVMS